MAGSQFQIQGIDLLEELGHGTHSVVYRARRGDTFCAVKVPLRNETGSKLQILSRRFRREAMALARLRHPFLPRIMEVGTVDRMPYIVMELVAGETLAERLTRGRLTEEQAVELGSHLASALQVVHQNGLVHRDVKPRNIVFETATGRVRLVDFGFAASVDAAFRILEPVGTLEYGAPEQVSDRRQRVDGRADLYALGCVLYECLAGCPPFTELDPRRLLHQHLGLQIPDVRDVAPQVSRAVASILKRLLARTPDERYPDATTLLHDFRHLDEIRQGRPVAPVLPASEMPAVTSPLLGRVPELHRLHAMMKDVERNTSRTVVLRGGSGSGKTRLARALIDQAIACGHQVLIATCHAWDRRPFSAIRELVESYARPGRDLPAAERARLSKRMRELAGDLAPLVKVLSPAMASIFADAAPVPQSRDAQHIFVEGLGEFVSKLLRESDTTMVLVDDLQWLDGGSRRVLRRAIDRVSAHKVLFLFATRGDLGDFPEADRFLQELDSEEINVGSLGDSGAKELIHEYLGASNLNADLLRSVARLSDGAPLSTLEIVRMMLDEGLLLPFWGTWKFDHDAVAAMQLPQNTIGILERRIKSLDDMTRMTISAAAIIGMTFRDNLLPSICALEEGHTTAGLAEARRATLIEAGRNGTHRFLHDSVREVLLRSLPEQKRREYHQRAAEAIEIFLASDRDEARRDGSISSSLLVALTAKDRSPALSPDDEVDACYSLASHYANGIPGQTPLRAYESNLTAAKLAFYSFDNERALLFFAWAAEAAKALPPQVDPEPDFIIGEAKLRIGDLEESLAQFERVLSYDDDRVRQASALSRMAWIHEMRLDTAQAWGSLEQAFQRLGQRPANDSISHTLRCALAWLWGRLRRRKPTSQGAEREYLEVLCALYYQTGRLATIDGKPLRVLQVAFKGLAPAERLGPSKALASVYLTMSFVFIALGRRSTGRKYLARAEGIARSIGDPVALAHSLQVHAAVASWEGDVRDALETGRRCLDEYGHWRELSEYCLLAYNQQVLEGFRGRSLEAWSWMQRILDKVNQHEGRAFLLELLELGAQAALTSLGREAEADSKLMRLREMTVRTPVDSGFYAGTYGPRIRLFTERGDLGAAFEALVAEFEGRGFDPRRVHLAVAEYYIHVAHARVHLVLRASAEERGFRQQQLQKALRDLKAAIRMPIIRAHALVIEAQYSGFRGDSANARRFFAEAENLAQRESAPWVLYSVYRGRAHLLRAAGLDDAAGDQARLAEALAREHGMEYRRRWIREEFGLRRSRYPELGRRQPSGSSHESSNLRKVRGESPSAQLLTLLRISRLSPEDLDVERQARAALDELIFSVRADRGELFLGVSEGADGCSLPKTVVRRIAGGKDAPDPNENGRKLVDAAFTEWSTAPDKEPSGSAAYLMTTTSQSAILVAPLEVGNVTIGSVYLERDAGRGAFSETEGDLLVTLANQIPVALELARALSLRHRAEEELQNAQKLQAMGHLAEGVAREFGRVLDSIRASAEALAATSVNGTQDRIRMIQDAAARADELRRHLIAFSRRGAARPEPLDVNERIRSTMPLLHHLFGESQSVIVRLANELELIKADPRQIDHMLVTLAVRAREVMPQGGKVVIETLNTTLDAADVKGHTSAKPGQYVRMSISDTGPVIDSGAPKRISEPFASPDEDTVGTFALGTLYRDVVESGGFIDVESIASHGTTFRFYWPKTVEKLVATTVADTRRLPGSTLE